MSFTRAQFRIRTLRKMDASGTTRWDTTTGTTGEVDQVLGLVFRREWKRILNVNAKFRVNLVQPTTDASGRIAFASLTAGSGDSLKNAYRIIQFSRANYVYSAISLEEGVLSEQRNVASRVWWQEGLNVMILPQEVSTALNGSGDGFWVNYYPTGIEALSTDTATVDFPDGYEEIVCLEAAAMLLAKGGAESDTAMQFKALAEELRADMLQDMARLATKPNRPRYEDAAASWAGN